jgi:hypothetical protein
MAFVDMVAFILLTEFLCDKRSIMLKKIYSISCFIIKILKLDSEKKEKLSMICGDCCYITALLYNGTSNENEVRGIYIYMGRCLCCCR